MIKKTTKLDTRLSKYTDEQGQWKSRLIKYLGRDRDAKTTEKVEYFVQTDRPTYKHIGFKSGVHGT